MDIYKLLPLYPLGTSSLRRCTFFYAPIHNPFIIILLAWSMTDESIEAR